MESRNKKILILFLSLALILSAFGCGTDGAQTSDMAIVPQSGNTSGNSLAEDPEETSREADGQFLLTGGSYETSGSTYTITSAGEYTLRGRLEDGQIIVDAGSEDEVVLILDSVYISSSSGAAITVLGADEVKIKSSEGSYNTVRDLRSGDGSDEEYDAVIWSDCDMKISGSGTLIVSTDHTNGIKSKNDLEIKDVTLKVTSSGTALKGNDSVSMESGNVLLISTGDEGIVTNDSDISSKGNQRGDITVISGRLTVYSASEGIRASHDVIIGKDNGEPEIYIYTADFSPYTVSSMNNDTSMAIKADGTISVFSGRITAQSTGDCLHAVSGVMLENGTASSGDIILSGGELVLQSGDDAIHADGSVTLSGAIVTVPSSHEGVEANVIEISSGSLVAVATDDGLNATSGSLATAINISGGYVDVTVTGSDVDAIDSNGDITVSGGTVIAKCTSSVDGMAGSFDCDGTFTVTGGTVIGIGGICKIPGSDSVRVYISDSLGLDEGSYLLRSSDGTIIAEFDLDMNCTSFWTASDTIFTGGSYSLERDGLSVISWSQEQDCTGDQSVGGPGIQ
ncbi:MAG: carbohydrate-binding domain-containing protein [Eubacteriales bacterium]|nr:carbohydrate-binding domain-containing protein [Eubacteriales bacterium]